ncbi:MAG TPA: hypothetical protein VF251_07260, partial [Pyrinomonadaceae bacterium]
LTQPEPREQLVAFYRKVHPEGPGWKRIAAEAGVDHAASGGIALQLINWVLGCVLIYASLFGIGKLIMKEWWTALLFIGAALISGLLISRNLSRMDWRHEM